MTIPEHHLIDWREAEARLRPVTYRPGDLNWRAGFEHAARQAAIAFDAIAGEEQDPAWRAFARRVAVYLRNMKPEAPR